MERIFEEVAADMRRLTHPHLFHHHTSAETAAAAPTITTNTPEDHMSLLAELEADAKALAAKFETVDRTALDALERIQANPDTAQAFDLLDALTHVSVAPEILATAIGVLKMTLGQATTSAQATEVPGPPPVTTGPQIAGQA